MERSFDFTSSLLLLPIVQQGRKKVFSLLRVKVSNPLLLSVLEHTRRRVKIQGIGERDD